MTLVEREEHLEHLDRALAHCQEQRVGVVLVDAPAGCGRTELLRTASSRGRRAGMLVLTAECARGDHELAFGVLRQLRQHPDVPATLPTPAAAAGAGAEMLRTAAAWCEELLRLAATRPLLIAVDDVRHADLPSLHVLRQLARRLTAAPLLLLFTDDDTEPQPRHLAFRAELLRQAELWRLRLGPLSVTGVRQLLTDRWDPATADCRAAELHRASGGNPLLLNGLVDDYEAAPGATGAYRLALLSWLHRSHPLTIEVLQGLAVLADPTPGGLAELVAAEEGTVAGALAAMSAAGLLERGRLRGQVDRSIVLSNLSEPERRSLHRRAALLLHRGGAPALEQAHQLLAAGGDEDAPWAAQVLLAAANEALLAGGATLARDCLRLAYRSPAAADLPARARVLLTEAEWQLNPAVAAEQLTPLAAAATTGRLPSADQVTVVHRLLWHGRDSEARELIERLRAEAPAELPAFETWLAGAHPRLADRRPAVTGRPTPGAAAGADPWLHTTGMLAGLALHGPGPDALRRATEVLSGMRLEHLRPWAAEAALLALLVLTSADRADVAERCCRRLLAEAETHGAGTWRAWYAAAMAYVTLQRGDLAGARDFGRSALTDLSPASWGVAVGFPLGSVILAATRRGDYDEAARYLGQSVPEAMFDSRYGLHYLHARGHHHLAAGHHYPALADFLSCGELIRGWGLEAAAVVPWRTDAAGAWLRLGNHEQARQLVYEQAARADSTTGRARARHLRALAATSPAARRPEILTEALELFERCGDRYGQAEVLADLCIGYHALGDGRRARMVFRRAWRLAALLGATPLSHRLMSATGEVPPATAGTGGAIGSLTAAERRVAGLAVMGCTNREIAAKLHVTASTVEQHLTRVYRKLGVRRRRDLPATFDEPAG